MGTYHHRKHRAGHLAGDGLHLKLKELARKEMEEMKEMKRMKRMKSMKEIRR